MNSTLFVHTHVHVHRFWENVTEKGYEKRKSDVLKVSCKSKRIDHNHTQQHIGTHHSYSSFAEREKSQS